MARAHARVVERLLGLLEAHHDRLGAAHLIELQVRHRLERIVLHRIGEDQAVQLPRRQRRDRGRRIVAGVDLLDAVEIRGLAPVRLHLAQDGDLAGIRLHQLERAGALRARLEHALLLRIQHRRRIVEQVLGHRDLRLLAVQPHRVVVHLLDRVGVPQLGGGLAVGALHVLQQIALDQPDEGRADGGVGELLEVPHHVVGGEVAAVAPLHALADVQCPGLEVGADRPAFRAGRDG